MTLYALFPWLSEAVAAPRPVLDIDVETDPCGILHGTVETHSRRLPRTVQVSILGETFDVIVPVGQNSARFSRFVGRGVGEVAARWWFVDAELERYRVYDLSDAMSVSSPEAFPLGEGKPIAISIDERCDLSKLSITVEEKQAGLLQSGVPGGHRLELPVEGGMGTYNYTVRLSSGGQTIAERTVDVQVTAPCLDEDGDGHLSCRAQDCDDHDATVFSGAMDGTRNGRDENCDGIDGPDQDGDGFVSRSAGGDDCDDSHPDIFPGAANGLDHDNDGRLRNVVVDYDCDGRKDKPFGAIDCDDDDPRIPRAEEATPDGIDQDCDGLVDDGTYAFDDDGDGITEIAGDCDDSDALVHPGTPERPNCRDDDCDAQVDEGVERPRADDSYEGSEDAPTALPGAVRPRDGSEPARTVLLNAVTRDERDIERYDVFVEGDSSFSFHRFRVAVREMADRAHYQISISGPKGRFEKEEVDGSGTFVETWGEQGLYNVSITPLSSSEDLDYCPLILEFTAL